jgi:hypothetical protein
LIKERKPDPSPPKFKTPIVTATAPKPVPQQMQRVISGSQTPRVQTGLGIDQQSMRGTPTSATFQQRQARRPVSAAPKPMSHFVPQESAYSQYTSQTRENYIEKHLADSICVYTPDDTINNKISISPLDFANNYSSVSMCIPTHVKQIHVRVGLTSSSTSGVQCAGIHSTTFFIPTNVPGQVLPSSRQEPLTFKPEREGYDVVSTLGDTLNSFEIVVTGTKDGKEVCQSLCLFVTRI